MAKEIILTQDKVAIVDDEDFDYLNQFCWRAQKPSGKRTYELWHAFTALSVGHSKKQVVVGMHRVVIARMTDDPLFLVHTAIYTDHINSDGLDNRRSNLRKCSNTENQINKRVQGNNTTGYKGVTRQGDKYVVRFTVPAKGRVFGGTFINPIDAARKYNQMAVEHFGKFALLNEGV